jgi:hypothetical protein
VTCIACGASIDRAASNLWTGAAALGHPDDEDENEEDEDEDQDQDAMSQSSDGRSFSTNLDDNLERFASSDAVPRCVCGAVIRLDSVRASIARGGIPCECGRSIPVAEAPISLRACDWRARYILGGPLRVGDPDGLVTILFTEG